MIDSAIQWSIKNRLAVVVAAAAFVVWGVWQVVEMPIDVLPDLAAPTVTVVVEADGMAPEEVENQIAEPIEASLSGAGGVRRIRSSTGIGNTVIDVEFDWDTDVYRARQSVSERLQVAAPELPPEVDRPVIAPMSSEMGDIMFFAVTSKEDSPVEVRDFADWQIQRRLAAIPGISQVVPLGGGVKQYQVIVDPHEIAALGIGVNDVVDGLGESNRNVSAGFYEENNQEYLIYGLGRFDDESDIGTTVLMVHEGRPIRVADVADVQIGPALQRGEGAYNGDDAVLVAVKKQPDANTLELTAELETALDDIERSLPESMQLQRDLFRQADFIEVAVDNVVQALRNGSLLVILIIFAFLASLRATSITAAVIPLSLLAAAVVLGLTGGTINTMTLGGMAIAVGVLVDDAIVVVENVVRRLRLNADCAAEHQRERREVIFEACREVISPLFYANLVVLLVLLPLMFLTGMEGRLLEPLAIAFLVAVLASLAIAMTVTPAMCSYLLPETPSITEDDDGPLARLLKGAYEPVLEAALPKWKPLMIGSVVAVLVAGGVLATAGQSFLPEFNEGSMTVHVNSLPGTSLETSHKMGSWVEEILHRHPEVTTTGRRTGRAQQDEHAQGVHASEIEVGLEMGERSREEFLAALRDDLSEVPGVNIGIDQPISHRIDHMLTGARSSVAINIVGDDLYELRRLADETGAAVSDVEGVVDLNIEQQTDVPFLMVDIDHDAVARRGLRVSTVTDTIETAFVGRVAGRFIEQQRGYDLLVRYADDARQSVEQIRRTTLSTDDGRQVPLEAVADVRRDQRPNEISREDGRRQITVSFNVAGGDLVGVVDAARQGVADDVDMPEGYFANFGGQYERAREASTILILVTLLAMVGIFVALIMGLNSSRDAVLVLLNLPLALIGGVVGVFALDGILSVASLIGFITLFGIATRNGLLLITHIRHLHLREGVDDIMKAVKQGAMERVSPIVMTALASGLGLLPLAMQAGQPGGEIQGPMAVVILSGLVTSTILNMIVIPALYLRFGALVEK